MTPPDPQKQSERREETGKCDSVRISARGCRSPLLCPDLLRQKSGSHQQSVWSSGDGPAVDGFCPVILQICMQLCSGLLRDISGGSGNNASLGHTCRWSSFMGLRWVKLNEPASRSDFGWNKRDSTHLFFSQESVSCMGQRHIHWIKAHYYGYLRLACGFPGHRKDKKVMKEKNSSPFTDNWTTN